MSPAFARLWERPFTVVHAQLVKALSGQGSKAISIQTGYVTLSLGPVIDAAKQQLAARGLTIVNKLPSINPTFPLFSAKHLVKTQTGYHVLNDLKIALPIAALLLLAAGVHREELPACARRCRARPGHVSVRAGRTAPDLPWHLIFVFRGRPAGAVVIGIALVLLVILGLIELIGRPPAASATQAP